MKPIAATPPIDRIALTWAERSRTAYRAGNVDEAVRAARMAVDGHARFGSRKVATPQIVTACAALLKRYEKEDCQE